MELCLHAKLIAELLARKLNVDVIGVESDVEFLRVDADHLTGVGPDADRVRNALQSFGESIREQVA